MEKPDGKCSPILAVNKFLGLFSHPSSFYMKHSRSA